MEQSVHLASLMQKQFRQPLEGQTVEVHQAGFLVLKASAMPSILIELGFISTRKKERYLNSEEGAAPWQKASPPCFLKLQREHELRLTGVSKTIVPTEQEPKTMPRQLPKGSKV